MHLTAASHF